VESNRFHISTETTMKYKVNQVVGLVNTHYYVRLVRQWDVGTFLCSDGYTREPHQLRPLSQEEKG